MRRTVLLVVVMAAVLVMASGVALAVNKIGTNGPDTLRGTDGADNLVGLGGNDVLLGLGGSDNLLGGDGKDAVLGGNERRPAGGDKNLVGGDGNDFVGGGKGADNMVGGDGNDLLVDNGLREFSKDTLSGGSGNDVIDVFHKPAEVKDVVVCGPGFDRVISDRADLVAPDCEKVVVVRGSREDVFDKQIDSSRPSRRASSKVCLGSREIGANLATEGG
jgi:Ca2+-binding RTX toxin-like protein